MENRRAKLVVTKGGSGSTTFRATLPSNWIRKMGLSEDLKNLKLEFDGKQIIIKNNEEEIKMLEKMLELSIIKIDNKMNADGFIDDSDNTDRFLDSTANEVVKEIILQGNNDIDLYYEKEDDIETYIEELLEMIKEHMSKTYKSEGSTNDRGDFAGCYYKDKKGLKKWSESGE